MTDARPTFLSLFAGIGGLDLGLERAGWRCVAQVEIDPFCRRVLAKHWPDVPRFEDVRAVTAADFHEPIDLIAGGFPCQDISNAGRRVGIDGQRSGLWSEFFRLVCELRPRVVLVENVAALLTRGLDRVLGDLASSRYDAEWDCIPAAAVGAPHLRDRLFIVAADADRLEHEGRSSADGRSTAPLVFAHAAGGERQGGGISVRPWRQDAAAGDAGGGSAGLDVSDSIFAGLEGDEREELAGANEGGHHAYVAGSGWWATEPDVGRVANGVPARVDRLKGLGNAVVPQVAEFIGRRILAACPTQIAAPRAESPGKSEQTNCIRILVPQLNPLTDKELDSGPPAAKTPAGAASCADPTESDDSAGFPNTPTDSESLSHPNPLRAPAPSPSQQLAAARTAPADGEVARG